MSHLFLYVRKAGSCLNESAPKEMSTVMKSKSAEAGVLKHPVIIRAAVTWDAFARAQFL